VEEVPGWDEPIDACRRIAELPPAARAYVAHIEELLSTPVELVSVGRERSELAR
jgi:adenylosuccinate synthase